MINVSIIFKPKNNNIYSEGTLYFEWTGEIKVRYLKLRQEHAYLMLMPILAIFQVAQALIAQASIRCYEYTLVVVKDNVYIYMFNVESAPPHQQNKKGCKKMYRLHIIFVYFWLSSQFSLANSWNYGSGMI